MIPNYHGGLFESHIETRLEILTDRIEELEEEKNKLYECIEWLVRKVEASESIENHLKEKIENLEENTEFLNKEVTFVRSTNYDLSCQVVDLTKRLKNQNTICNLRLNNLEEKVDILAKQMKNLKLN